MKSTPPLAVSVFPEKVPVKLGNLSVKELSKKADREATSLLALLTKPEVAELNPATSLKVFRGLLI